PEVRRSLRLGDAYSRADAWRSMALWLGQWELRGSGHWALQLPEGPLIGRAGLHRPEAPDWPGLEVGWALHPDHWGRGFATEAGRRAVDYAFEALDADEVVSVILPGNVRSQQVAARLGLAWSEDRELSVLPGEPHGIWRLPRRRWRPGGPVNGG
ncbi:MAG TPA: GNAT family N-acetyltransferase, partial [Acidimicrobiales bacterium]|nr:GNAT family N-acetyltransferase [Acidimicrobiales bacterium]